MQLLGQDDVSITRGRTQDNLSNLPARFFEDMRRSFGRSAFGAAGTGRRC
jgi:hypothetical protein